MSTLQEQLNQRYAWQAKMIAETSQLEAAFEGLGLLNVTCWPDFGSDEYVDGKLVKGLYIKLTPSQVGDHSTLADAAQALLTKVGRWTKSFDATNNLIQLTGEYRNVRIVVQDAPPATCTVQKVEEEVEVPEQIIAAHTETKVRYVMVGDCDPLMTQQSEAVSA